MDLVAAAPMVDDATVFDIGTGTGVLAAVLARRGAATVVATDLSSRAVTCARENVHTLGLANRVSVTRTHLFPRGRADLLVCNPPWLPGTPSSPLDAAVFDPGGRMLAGFLHGAADHLNPAGEAWLVLSNLAELLGLRTRADLLTIVDKAGLTVLDRIDTLARHPRARDRRDPFASARASEVVSLWRLGIRPASRR